MEVKIRKTELARLEDGEVEKVVVKYLRRKYDLPEGAYIVERHICWDEDTGHGSPITHQMRFAYPADTLLLKIINNAERMI